MNIGDKIKLVRRHRGLTQQQLGILIDIKNGAANRIAQYETGYRTPKAEIVEKIAKVLNVREETFYMPKDRKSTRLNSSHRSQSRMPSSA